jgi:hypothetical protein
MPEALFVTKRDYSFIDCSYITCVKLGGMDTAKWTDFKE